MKKAFPCFLNTHRCLRTKLSRYMRLENSRRANPGFETGTCRSICLPCSRPAVSLGRIPVLRPSGSRSPRPVEYRVATSTGRPMSWSVGRQVRMVGRRVPTSVGRSRFFSFDVVGPAMISGRRPVLRPSGGRSLSQSIVWSLARSVGRCLGQSGGRPECSGGRFPHRSGVRDISRLMLSVRP